MTTRLSAEDLLAALEYDAALLLHAARAAGLTAAVPTCPDWTVEDLVRHVAQVYEHKVQCIRHQAPPDPWPPDRSAAEPLAWFTTALDELVAELRLHDPGDTAWTWFPPEQTVGFWTRRMAQETVIHRVDAQLAAGEALAPIDTGLAVDGIDEMLAVFLDDDWSEWPGAASAPPAFGATVTADGASWQVLLEPLRVAVVETLPEVPQVTVTGRAADVLLWLWGRPAAGQVTVGGDESLQVALRERLTAAAQ